MKNVKSLDFTILSVVRGNVGTHTDFLAWGRSRSNERLGNDLEGEIEDIRTGVGRVVILYTRARYPDNVASIVGIA